MPQAKYKQTVFIGRFQIPHRAHAAIVEEALRQSDRLLLLFGSSNFTRKVRNPFTFQERVEMFQEMMPDAFESGRIVPVPIDDYLYRDSAWVQAVQDVIRRTGVPDEQTALIGCKKDATSYYLDRFPNLPSIAMPFDDPVNATELRECLYHLALVKDKEAEKQDQGGFSTVELDATMKLQDWAPLEIFGSVTAACNEPWMLRLARRWVRGQTYRARARGNGAHPVKQVTVDSVVIKSGHVLVGVREDADGETEWALPGGHVEEFETIENATLRELDEETNIDVSKTQLLAARQGSPRVYDYPFRSDRGRFITHASLFDLGTGPLPKVTPGTDFKECFWLPLSEVEPAKMFEDHGFIVQAEVARL